MTAPSTAPRKWRVTVLISGSGSNLGALLSALPTSLANVSITHVLSSRATAFGLTRAANHDPPIPNSAFSLVTFKKATGLGRPEWELELARRVRETRPDLVVLAGWMLVLSEGFLDVLKRDWVEESLSLPPSDDAEGKESKVTPSLQTLGSSPYVKGALKEGTPIPIINLHPALPGTFPGAHAIQDAWDAFNAPLPPSEPEPTSALDAAINAALEGLSLASDSPSTPSTSAPARITKTGIMIHRVIPLLDAGEPVLVKEIEMVEGESVEGLEERIHVVEHLALVEAVGKVVEMLADGSWWD